MLMLTNKIPLRFSKSSDVDMLTGTTVAVYLEDTMGDLPTLTFHDRLDFIEYWEAIEKEFYEVYSEIRQLKIENRESKEQLLKENKELQKQVILFKTRRKDVEELIIKNSKLKKENTNLQVELLSQSEEVEILSEKNKELKARCEEYRKLSVQYKQKYDEKISDNTFLEKENNELKTQLEAFQNKLCELGVSDVKLYGKRYYTGLEEWLE